MKRVSICLFCSLCLQLSMAQNNVSGKLVDENKSPVRFANIILNNLDSTIYEGATSDSLGYFQIANVKPNTYLLKVLALGYGPLTKEITVSQETELGELQLATVASELNEIVISDTQSSVEHQFDKIVLSSSNSVTTSAGNVLDLVEKLPGLMVNHQSKSILIRGREDVQVMINNKPANMPIAVVLQMLSGVNAAAVEKIELLTAPSSKYDANGTAGILSIVFKDLDDVGTRFIYNVNTGWGRGAKVAADVNFLKKTSKLTTSLLVSHSYDDTQEDWESYQYAGSNSISTLVNRDPEISNSFIKGELSYAIGSKLTLDANASFGTRRWQMNSSSNTLKTEQGNSRFIALTDKERDTWTNATAGLGLSYQIAKSKTLTINYDRLYYKNTDYHNYTQTDSESDGSPISQALFSIEKETPINIDVLKADFENKVSSTVAYNVGAKQTFAKFLNALDFEPAQSYYSFLEGKYNLLEKTFATYGNVVVTRPKIKAEAGVRYEHTFYELLREGVTQLNSRTYAAFFPSFNAFYSFNEKKNLQLIYNYRINRPSYSSLAPFIVFLDPYTFFTGNENLQPSFVHNFEFKHGVNDNGVNDILLSAAYSHEDSPMIGFQPEVDEDGGYQTISPRNLSNRKTLAISIYAPIRITNVWQVTSDVSYLYTSIGNAPTNFSTSLGGYRASANSIFNITSSLTAELSGVYQSTSLFGLTKQRGFGFVNAGVKKKIKSIEISATISDIFKTNNWLITGNDAVGNLSLKRYYNFETRIFRIGFAHNIGNQKVSNRKLSPVSAEERNRI
jgi:hypothetical protein